MMTDSDEDRRRYKRVRFHAEATLRDERTNASQKAEVQDISLKGVLLECREHDGPTAEDEVTVIIELGGRDEAGNLPHIELRGEVVHREGDHVGVTWTEIDADSMGHLRRLLELNLDYEEIRRELSELVSR